MSQYKKTVNGLDHYAASALSEIVYMRTDELQFALQGDDELIAGSGYDGILLGGSGDDTYLVSKYAFTTVADAGEGNDRIVFNNLSQGEAYSQWLMVELDGRHAMLTDGNFGGLLIVDYKTSASAIETVEFSDGAQVTVYQLIDDMKDRGSFASLSLSSLDLGSSDLQQIRNFINSYQNYNAQYEAQAALPDLSAEISGTALEGEILTVSTSIDHLQGVSQPTFVYQWKADGEIVYSPYGTQFELEQEHVGKKITVDIGLSGYNGNFLGFATAELESPIANINDAPEGAPILFGSPYQLHTLSVSNNFNDEDGYDFVSYQWFADEEVIPGAKWSNFYLSQAYVGKQISVEATYIDNYGQIESVWSESTIPVYNTTDATEGAVYIHGRASVGEVLTLTNTFTNPDGIADIKYYWQVTGRAASLNDIPDQFELTSFHLDKQISVIAAITTKTGGTNYVYSDSTEPVFTSNNAPEGEVEITGNAQVDEWLSLTENLQDPDGLGEFSYQWLASGERITGATGTSYQLTDQEIGESISVVVSYVDGEGMLEKITSSETSAVSHIVQGVVGAGHIVGGAIYIDSNGDYIADADEFTGVYSDNNGEFSIETTLGGSVLVKGGLNTETRLPNLLTLSAPSNSNSVNHLTTLLDRLDDSLSLASSHTLDAFGVARSIDLLSRDSEHQQDLDLHKANSTLELLATRTGDEYVIDSLGSLLPLSFTGDIDFGDFSDPEVLNSLILDSRFEMESLVQSIEDIGYVEDVISLNRMMRSEVLGDKYKIAGLYAAFFDRAPDVEGLEFWLTEFAQGDASIADISNGFVQHPVFSETYNGMSDREFVEAIYQNVLGAEGDQAGIDYWVTELEEKSKALMVADFVQGALVIDLDSMKESAVLTEEEYQTAVSRQDYITFKAMSGVLFADKLGGDSNVSSSASDVVTDPAYIASVSILEGIDSDYDSFAEVESIIASALDYSEGDPVEYINAWAINSDQLLI